jgi:hypothetical protein
MILTCEPAEGRTPDTFGQVRGTGGGSSVGQSSGLIIRRSQVQVLPAPRGSDAPRESPQVRGGLSRRRSVGRCRAYVACTSRNRFERRRELVHVAVEQMAVDREREACRRMAERGLDGLGGPPGADHPRGG